MRTILACCLVATTLWSVPASAQKKRPSLAPVNAASAASPTQPQAPAQQAAETAPLDHTWRVLRTAWTDRDEQAFGEFVRRIGESDCRTVHECLTDAKSNPLYRASNPPGMHFRADCADLPYLLRVYFAWKNGLPFSYSSAVTPVSDGGDIRYNDGGNRISSRRDLTGPAIDARREIPRMLETVTPAHFRYAPDYSGELLPDHYPVRISRETIAPLRSIWASRHSLQGDAPGQSAFH